MGTIGDRVRRLREEAGLDRPELARRVGAKTTSIQTLEEKPQRSSKYLPALAQFFGVRLEWLSTGKGAKHPDGPAQDKPPPLHHEYVSTAMTVAALEYQAKGLAFNRLGDVNVFIAAYDHVANPTHESRNRFNEAVERAASGEVNAKRSADASRRRN